MSIQNKLNVFTTLLIFLKLKKKKENLFVHALRVVLILPLCHCQTPFQELLNCTTLHSLLTLLVYQQGKSLHFLALPSCPSPPVAGLGACALCGVAACCALQSACGILSTERVSHRCVLSGASLVPLIHENALGKAGIQSFSDLYECVCAAQDGLIF